MTGGKFYSISLLYCLIIVLCCRINYDLSEDTENDCENVVNNLPVPCGKHTIFSSPDLQMGKGVHWRYEDFDKTVTAPATTPGAKPSVGLKSAPASTAKPLINAVTPSKNMSSEDRVQFWLAKGPKTPIR